MALRSQLMAALNWLSPRKEIRRITALSGERRVTFYLTRNGKFEYVVEKYDATARLTPGLKDSPWHETYASESFDSLLAARESAAASFTWMAQQ